MIDSHCHLDHSPLLENLKNVIGRAKSVGVNQFLTISTSIKSFENIKKIISHYKEVFGTVGIHPHETELHKDISKNSLIKLKSNLDKIIGIGETGLDFYYENSDKIIQKKIFIEHIEASLELNLPLIIHSRSAEEDTFNILNDYYSKKPKILMHCFTGSKDFAKKLLNIGAYFSFSGIITFKNASELVDTALFLPLDRLLVETDAPFLAPEPKRGLKNEPSFIIHTAKKLAKIKNKTFDEIDSLTNKNFSSLFTLKK